MVAFSLNESLAFRLPRVDPAGYHAENTLDPAPRRASASAGRAEMTVPLDVPVTANIAS